MRNLVIIHFSPVELYPPVQNLLVEMDKRVKDQNVIVLTTQNYARALSPFRVPGKRVRIIRSGALRKNSGNISRYTNYLVFYLLSLLQIIRYRPTAILYFETLSSFPAFIYNRFFKRIKIFIHYHEYTSAAEYKNGMKLNNFFHGLEKLLYPEAKWISHTNCHRMEMFKNDIKPTTLSNFFIFPNYPPKIWKREPKYVSQLPVKMVYVGAFSLETMYTREFSSWVMSQKGKVCLDIYSYNFSIEAKSYIEELKTSWIRIYDGVDYNQLPSVLDKYDVGVVLYKGVNKNHVYSVPNKLFEYLACGLSVWFPNTIIGSLDLCTKDLYPEVLALDFRYLSKYSIEDFISRQGYEAKSTHYFCEDATKELTDNLLK